MSAQTPENTNQNTDLQVTNTDPVPDLSWQAAVYDTNQARVRAETRAQELEARLAAIEARNNTTPAPTLDSGDIFNEPEKFRAVLNSDVAAQVAPINAFVAELERKNAYHVLKSRIKNMNPNVSQAINAIEGNLDNEFLNNPLLRPDEATFMKVVESIVGRMALSGAFNRPNIPNPAPTNPNPPVIPPTVRPSSAPITQPNANQLTSADFTENENRLMREKGLTPDEYVQMRDCPPTEAKRVWTKILADRKARNGGQ